MLNLEVPSMWKNGAQSAVSLAPRQKRENFDISFENDTKVKRKWLKNLNLKSETKVLLEETMEKLKKKLFQCRGGSFKHDTNASSYKTKMVDKFNHIKVNFLHGNKYLKWNKRSNGTLKNIYSSIHKQRIGFSNIKRALKITKKKPSIQKKINQRIRKEN